MISYHAGQTITKLIFENNLICNCHFEHNLKNGWEKPFSGMVIGNFENSNLFECLVILKKEKKGKVKDIPTIGDGLTITKHNSNNTTMVRGAPKQAPKKKEKPMNVETRRRPSATDAFQVRSDYTNRLASLVVRTDPKPGCCLRGTVADGLPCSALLPTLIRMVGFSDPLAIECLGWFQIQQQAPDSWSSNSQSNPISTKNATSQSKNTHANTNPFHDNTSTENIPHMSQNTTTAQCQSQRCRA